MLEPLDPTTQGQLHRQARLIFPEPWTLAGDWLRGRSAAVEESALHLDQDMSARYADAYRLLGVRDLLAVATEPLGDSTLAYRLEATQADLLAFNRECSGLNYTLTDSPSFTNLVACTSEDFILIAGDRPFVLACIGGDIAAARAQFEEYAESHAKSMQPVLHRALAYFDTLSRSPNE